MWLTGEMADWTELTGGTEKSTYRGRLHTGLLRLVFYIAQDHMPRVYVCVRVCVFITA